jgi:hypothetical protein
VRPQDHSATGRVMSVKNSNDTIGNRSPDLPVCSAVPQPLIYKRYFAQSLQHINDLSTNKISYSEINIEYYDYTFSFALITHRIKDKRNKIGDCIGT